MNSREVALQILTRIEQEQAFAAPLVDSLGIDERERRFVRTLVFGVLRWRSTLDFAIQALSGRPVKKLDAVVRQILRLGLIQLMETDVPPHAAVNETVALAAKRAGRARGLVNAVLRRAARDGVVSLLPSGDDTASIALRFGHPEWMIRRWASTFGFERTAAIAAANQQLSFPDLLLNERKLAREQIIARLEAKGAAWTQSTLVASMIRLHGSTAALQEEIEEGLVHPMDEGSGAVASLLDAGGRTILDLAAAPGGKSLFLASRGTRVVAHDISLSRLRPLQRKHRAWFDAAASLVIGDGRKPPFRGPFDAVLLDAPCSATGTIRRSPEIKWRLVEDDLPSFTRLQRSMLHGALDVTGHECLYSTCSLEPEENEEVVHSVLAERTEFEIVDLGERAGSALANWVERGVLRLTPEAGCDGFTAHLLRRTESPV